MDWGGDDSDSVGEPGGTETEDEISGPMGVEEEEGSGLIVEDGKVLRPASNPKEESAEGDVAPEKQEEAGRLDEDENPFTNHAREVKGEIRRGETLSTSFERYDLGVDMAGRIVEALKGIFSFRKAQPGNKWELKLNVLGRIEAFTFHYATLDKYYVRREGDSLQGYRIEGETQVFVEAIAGTIEESLSVSLWKLGESDQLTQKIADIFVWDIDFYSDIRKGDEWRVLVEKHYYDGRFVKYGQVIAASFKGSYLGEQYAFYFETPDSKRAEYFDVGGNSLQKSFLRAPLNTTRVTSSFGFRMHPTLHKYKKHNGVDYGAPRGTPVWAIASGKVTGAGWMGPCGKGVTLRHMNDYESVYCHLSSISVGNGQRVNQKQMIGRVGNTGRSTGPHLHFGVKKRGQWMDPLKLKYEPGKPISGRYRDRFSATREMLKEKLDVVVLPVFYGPEAPEGYVDPTRPEKKTDKKVGRSKKKRKKSKVFRPRPQGIKEVPKTG